MSQAGKLDAFVPKITRRFLIAIGLAVLDVLLLAPETHAAIIDYTTVADGTYASLSLGGTTVTGSAAIGAGTFSVGFPEDGIGIVGGGNNLTLDFGESMSIDLGTTATNVALTLLDVPLVGNVSFAFTAFNGLTNLGTFNLNTGTVNPQIYNLSSLAGAPQMTNFTLSVLSVQPPVGLMIQSVAFDAVSTPAPEPASLMLLGVGLAGMGVRRWRQRKA